MGDLMWCFVTIWIVFFALTVLHAYAAWFDTDLFYRLMAIRKLKREYKPFLKDGERFVLEVWRVTSIIGILFFVILAIVVFTYSGS